MATRTPRWIAFHRTRPRHQAPSSRTVLIAAATTKCCLTHAANPNLYHKLPYDPIADFAAVARLARAPLVIVVKPDSPIRTVADLIGDGCTVQLASANNPLFDPIAHYHRDPVAEESLRALVARFPPRRLSEILRRN